MKKIYLTILVLVLSFVMLGCKTAVVSNEGYVRLSLDDDFAYYVKCDNIPDFTFVFDGNLNTLKTIEKKYYTVFTNNDDIILSDALNILFKEYESKNCIHYALNGSQDVKDTLFSTLDEYGRVKNINMIPDDGKVYEETAYIALENGLKLTVDYRKFVTNGKVYYTWKYTSSITMYLYYPLMAVKENGEAELVIITLPNTVTFQVGPSLRVNNIINSKTYFYGESEDGRYTFNYPFNDSKDITIEEKKNNVIDYYVKGFSGNYSESEGCIYYQYLNNLFKVELLDNNFKMHYLGKVK